MYEKEYHFKVHNNLLNNKRYYLFRSKYSDLIYWRYLNGRVIEFGCGLGQNIFLHRGDSLGIDISEFALAECKNKGISTQRDIKKIKNESFESVLCVHVLEHLKNPYETIEEFYRVLKKDGKLVIILPFSKKNKLYKDFKSDISKHFYNWNFSSINEILIDIGFKIELNKFNYANGFSKFYNLPFPLAIRLLKILGKIRNKKEMIIVAKK